MQQGPFLFPADLHYTGGAGLGDPVNGVACREQLAVFIALLEQKLALQALELTGPNF